MSLPEKVTKNICNKTESCCINEEIVSLFINDPGRRNAINAILCLDAWCL